ncbi:hypothetical protein GOODEAATRI_011261 [Goodea atripinnis]|uniref:Transposase n=1 Tax=Goodea atripinnis TaxID=208336 RepID=A0ABV0P512_9TELE
MREHWRHILKSDKTKIELSGFNELKERESHDEAFKTPPHDAPVVKHGGASITRMACFNVRGTGTQSRWKKDYQEILQLSVKTATTRLRSQITVFQVDESG